MRLEESTSTMKMEAECFSKALVSVHKATSCHNPEGHNLINHHSENIKTYNRLQFLVAEEEIQPAIHNPEESTGHCVSFSLLQNSV
jgi:hypothetical protein